VNITAHGPVPAPGFNWLAVSWGGPDQPPTEHCSYCDAPLLDDEVPLILWQGGWCARFCCQCCKTWWGME
jgi:hypothetical protein